MASSSASISRSYDVFLSFRGEDTRRNFTDHLYSNLVAYGIHTFRDDEELQKGGDISSDLSKAIEESRIFLIIFSKNYAQSSWCLNELVKIMESMNMMQTQKESRAIPVFYHVKPSDVRKQLGSFGDAFACHEKDEEQKEMIQKWRSALKKAADLSGYHLDGQKYEAECIEEIREVVIKRLDRKPLYLGDNIVGMSFHLKQLRSLINTKLDEVHMIGIYGIGGIGKTTIVMAVYNDISSQFDGSSFLRDVGKKSKGGLLELQKKLIQDVLKCKTPKFDDTSEGINVIKERLCSKKVLIILDDVDEQEQLENLAGKYGWFGAKSRIIITTKNIQLLVVHGVKALYEVKELNHEGSTELFNWCAFKQNIPIPEGNFESLSNKLVKYANGLPIALKVIGQFLYGRTESDWKSALYQLEKTPKEEVYNILKVSYDKLEDYQKNIFLDIACFFRGSVKDFVSRILGEEAEIGIKVLHDRCLVSISDNKLEMHDLLQRMGWEIVRQQCLNEPGRRSRLWDFNDVDHVLRRNTGTEAIEGLFINYDSKIDLTSKAFKKMNSLRLLMVGDSKDFEGMDIFEGTNIPSWLKDESQYCGVHAMKDVEFPFYKLRYLKWDSYHLESLPRDFYAKDLIELSLIFSSIKQLWREKMFDKLKVMDLSFSLHLIEIPCFSSMPNLEILLLEGCKSLESLPSDFCELKFLGELSCSSCSKLKSFPKMSGHMRKLRKLNLFQTAIKEMPSSIGLLNALEFLDLSGCQNLESIPESLSNLSSLKTLDLSECPNNVMEGEILNQICHLSSLQELSLGGNQFCRIPAAISRLSNLQLLDLAHCEQLLQIPELPLNLRLLDAHGCLLSSPSFLPLSSLINCFKSECQVLESWPDLYFLGSSCYSGPGIGIIIPGRGGIPDWIWDKREGSEIEIELPKNWYENNDFLGFVISFPHVSLGSKKIVCHLNIYGNKQSANMDQLEFGSRCLECLIANDRDLSTVWVVYYPKVAIKERYRSDQWTHIKVSFLDEVEECGMHLIYGCCSNRQRIVKCQRKLCLRGNPCSELPTIHHPSQVDSLCLRDCKNLETLPTSLCEFKSLTTLSCSGSSRLTKFPEILENMGNLRLLNLSRTSIKELPSSIERLQGLQHLFLEDCDNLVNLPETICNLRFLQTLVVSFCSKLEKFPKDLGHLQYLENLGVAGLDWSLIQGAIQSDVVYMPSSEALNTSINHFSSILPSISQLSKLRILDLSHCHKLLQIPEFPLSLRSLDAHNCTNLETLSTPSSLLGFSLFKCFKSAIQEFESGSYRSKTIDVIISGRNGTPEWIIHQKKGSEMIIELPWNWYQNNDFFGFALYSVYAPIGTESKERFCELKCYLDFNELQFGFLDDLSSTFWGVDGLSSKYWDADDLSLKIRYSCCHNVGESNLLWVTYYPKVAIEKKYHSNKYRHLNASFIGYFDSKKLKAGECGFHLIHTPNEIITTSIPQYTYIHYKHPTESSEDSVRQSRIM